MEEKFPFEKKEKTIITLKESDTNPKEGCNPSTRSVEEIIDYGIVNINKQQGPTSHQITDYVKKILNLKKAGHSGTLDPNVTGSLVIALGRSTRIIQNLLKSGKEYVCLMRIHKKVKKEELKKVILSFTGNITQLPPLKSSIKRRKRKREIYYLTIPEIKEQHVLFKVGCEAGTYIRKLCHDIGQKLTTGAHMVQLVRTRVGPFSDKTWTSLHELKDSFENYKENKNSAIKKIILPVEEAVKHLPKIWVLDSTINSLCHGANLALPGVSKLESHIEYNDVVAVLSLKDELICTGNAKMNSKEIKKSKKGIVLENEKVFMKRDTYSRFS